MAISPRDIDDEREDWVDVESKYHPLWKHEIDPDCSLLQKASFSVAQFTSTLPHPSIYLLPLCTLSHHQKD